MSNAPPANQTRSVFQNGRARVNVTGEAPDGKTLTGSWTPLSGGTLGAPHDDQRTLAFLDNTTLLDTNDGGINGLTNPQNPAASDHWVGFGGNIQAIEFWSIAYKMIHGTIFSSTRQRHSDPADAAKHDVVHFHRGRRVSGRCRQHRQHFAALSNYQIGNGSIVVYNTAGVPAGSTEHRFDAQSNGGEHAVCRIEHC